MFLTVVLGALKISYIMTASYVLLCLRQNWWAGDLPDPLG